jgi:integrase
MSAKHKGIHLRPDQWPARDRVAWEELFQEGNLLDGCGAACQWRESTRCTNRNHYGRWLGWLSTTGRLDPEISPPRRATPDQVEAYARTLMETLSPRAAASALIGLKCVLLKMHSEADWRWLRDLTNRFKVWAGHTAPRRRDILPAHEVFDGALAELERLAASMPLSPRRRTHYRDTLIVALLTCCPVRARNLTRIEIGRHLRKVGTEWHLSLEAHETKTHQPVRYVVAEALVPWLELYLGQIRPYFPGAGIHHGLWPGGKARPLAYDTVYSRVRLTTERLFGVAVAPHSFRTIAATALADISPEDALHARALLGHRSPRTTERHYVRANQLRSSMRINTVLRDVRDGRRSRQ